MVVATRFTQELATLHAKGDRIAAAGTHALIALFVSAFYLAV
jgi:hypothetical protein